MILRPSINVLSKPYRISYVWLNKCVRRRKVPERSPNIYLVITRADFTFFLLRTSHDRMQLQNFSFRTAINRSYLFQLDGSTILPLRSIAIYTWSSIIFFFPQRKEYFSPMFARLYFPFRIVLIFLSLSFFPISCPLFFSVPPLSSLSLSLFLSLFLYFILSPVLLVSLWTLF